MDRNSVNIQNKSFRKNSEQETSLVSTVTGSILNLINQSPLMLISMSN